MGGTDELLDRIRGEISQSGPISFARFMELALYDPHDGYYARGPRRLGPDGDFVTASDAGRAFGRCMARQLSEIDRRLGPLDPFDVVEFGSGRGLLARDVLDAMAELDARLAGRLRYRLVDRSPAMRAESGRTVPEAESLDPRALAGGYRGCLLAVELFDALPVHRLRRRRGRLTELRVGVGDGGRFVEVEAKPTPEARSLAERYGAAGEEGTEAEVAPSALSQLETMARTLERGVIIVVDYGDRAAELYGPSRPHGTLVAYHRHSTRQDLLAQVGEQDLTAHVNFSALEDHAAELGLAVLGLTTQDRFLIANGILDEFESGDLAEARDPRNVKRRLQAMRLIHPESMGRRFKVLAFSKGCESLPELDGLKDPFSRSVT